MSYKIALKEFWLAYFDIEAPYVWVNDYRADIPNQSVAPVSNVYQLLCPNYFVRWLTQYCPFTKMEM